MKDLIKEAAKACAPRADTKLVAEAVNLKAFDLKKLSLAEIRQAYENAMGVSGAGNDILSAKFHKMHKGKDGYMAVYHITMDEHDGEEVDEDTGTLFVGVGEKGLIEADH